MTETAHAAPPAPAPFDYDIATELIKSDSRQGLRFRVSLLMALKDRPSGTTVWTAAGYHLDQAANIYRVRSGELAAQALAEESRPTVDGVKLIYSAADFTTCICCFGIGEHQYMRQTLPCGGEWREESNLYLCRRCAGTGEVRITADLDQDVLR